VKLEQSFDVDAPLEQVWEALTDVQRVAPCLPGAELTEAGEDGTYNGTFSVKIGPTSANYRGRLKMQELDEAARRATMLANGSDKRGSGGAKATIVSTLHEAQGGGTRVEVVTDSSITGRLASFGRGGMIEDVGNRLLREFAGCLQERLQAERAQGEPAPAAPPGVVPAPDDESTARPAPGPPPAAGERCEIRGLSLLLGVLWDRLRRWVNPRRRAARARR
jgi:carbon monoxide dehydrogenase subunit G